MFPSEIGIPKESSIPCGVLINISPGIELFRVNSLVGRLVKWESLWLRTNNVSPTLSPL